MCFRMLDFVNEYVEQLRHANADDEEPTAEGQSRVPTRQAQALDLANYRMVKHVLRLHLLQADIELQLAHAVSLWNLAFEFLPKWHNEYWIGQNTWQILVEHILSNFAPIFLYCTEQYDLYCTVLTLSITRTLTLFITCTVCFLPFIGTRIA